MREEKNMLNFQQKISYNKTSLHYFEYFNFWVIPILSEADKKNIIINAFTGQHCHYFSYLHFTCRYFMDLFIVSTF